MRKFWILISLFCTMALTNQTFAISISLLPSSQTIALGDTATVDLAISGLGSDGPVSLGAFALDFTYDDTVLEFSSVDFGLYLGDPSFFEADTYYDDVTSGVLYLDEVSWLSDLELDILQPGSFTLATIMFTVIDLGSSLLELENVDLSDALGFGLDPSIKNASVNPVPEPATILLLVSGMAGLGVFGRKRFRSPKA